MSWTVSASRLSRKPKTSRPTSCAALPKSFRDGTRAVGNVLGPIHGIATIRGYIPVITLSPCLQVDVRYLVTEQGLCRERRLVVRPSESCLKWRPGLTFRTPTQVRMSLLCPGGFGCSQSLSETFSQ